MHCALVLLLAGACRTVALAPAPDPSAPASAASVPVTLDIVNQPLHGVTPALRALYRGSLAEQLGVTEERIAALTFAARGRGVAMSFRVLPSAGAVPAVAAFELGVVVSKLGAGKGATFGKGLAHDIKTDSASGGIAPQISLGAVPVIVTPAPTPPPSPPSEESRLVAEERKHALSLEALMRAQLGALPTPPPTPAASRSSSAELTAHMAALRHDLAVPRRRPTTAAPPTTTAVPPTTTMPPLTTSAAPTAVTTLPPMPVMAVPGAPPQIAAMAKDIPGVCKALVC